MESVPLKQQTQVQVRVNEFIRSVYNWMAIGLGLTGLVAFYVASSPQLVQLIFGNQLLFFGLILVLMPPGKLGPVVHLVVHRTQNQRARSLQTGS